MAYNPNIDYAAELAREMKNPKIDWNKVSQLSQGRDAKISATGVNTQSTEDYINQLYAQRTPTNTVKPNTNVSSPSPSNTNSYSPSSSPNSYSPSPTYPKNPYAFMNEKAVQTAYIDPKTGNMSIVGGGGDMNSYQFSSRDDFLSKGYTPITDPNIISQLQQGVSNASTFKNTQQWQDWFNQNAGSVTPLSQAEINAATQRLADYNAYKTRASGGPVIALSDTNESNGLTYPVSAGGRLTDLVRDQYRYSNEANINALKQAYMQSKGELQGQIPGVQQNARSAYDANDAGYNQSLNELRAAMEQAGLYRGGDMLGRNVDLLTMRGQNAGNISQDKMNQVNAIQQAIAQLNAEEPLKIAEMGAANNAEEAQALLNATNMDMQNQLALAGLTGNINGTDTLDKLQQAYNQAMGIADRTGNMPDGTDTLQKILQAYNQAMGISDRTGTMPDGSKTLSAQQQAADLAYRQQQFEESARQFNANYGIDLKRLSLDQVQQQLDNKYRMGQLTLQQKNQALSEAQLTHQKQQDLRNYMLDSQQLLQQTQQSNRQYQQKSAETYSTYVQQAQKLLSDGATSTDVRSWILSLPIDNQQIADMLNVLGL